MISESEEIARLRIEERIQQAQARALAGPAPSARHQAVWLLRRWADLLEPSPPTRRPVLSR